MIVGAEPVIKLCAHTGGVLAPQTLGVHDEAWDELLAATPPGWFVGRPSFHHERDEWVMYAFDPRERAIQGRRKREWTAIAPTEVGVVREMARCLQEIGAGRVPR